MKKKKKRPNKKINRMTAIRCAHYSHRLSKTLGENIKGILQMKIKITFLSLMLLTINSWACSCALSPLPTKFPDSLYIFVVKILSETKVDGYDRKFEAKVTQIINSKAKQNISIYTVLVHLKVRN